MKRYRRARPAAHLRNLNRHRAYPRDDPPFGMVAIAHHPLTAIGQPPGGITPQPLIQLRLNRLLNEPMRPIAE